MGVDFVCPKFKPHFQNCIQNSPHNHSSTTTTKSSKTQITKNTKKALISYIIYITIALLITTTTPVISQKIIHASIDSTWIEGSSLEFKFYSTDAITSSLTFEFDLPVENFENVENSQNSFQKVIENDFETDNFDVSTQDINAGHLNPLDALSSDENTAFCWQDLDSHHPIYVWFWLDCFYIDDSGVWHPAGSWIDLNNDRESRASRSGQFWIDEERKSNFSDHFSNSKQIKSNFSHHFSNSDHPQNNSHSQKDLNSSNSPNYSQNNYSPNSSQKPFRSQQSTSTPCQSWTFYPEGFIPPLAVVTCPRRIPSLSSYQSSSQSLSSSQPSSRLSSQNNVENGFKTTQNGHNGFKSTQNGFKTAQSSPFLKKPLSFKTDLGSGYQLGGPLTVYSPIAFHVNGGNGPNQQHLSMGNGSTQSVMTLPPAAFHVSENNYEDTAHGNVVSTSSMIVDTTTQQGNNINTTPSSQASSTSTSSSTLSTSSSSSTSFSPSQTPPFSLDYSTGYSYDNGSSTLDRLNITFATGSLPSNSIIKVSLGFFTQPASALGSSRSLGSSIRASEITQMPSHSSTTTTTAFGSSTASTTPSTAFDSLSRSFLSLFSSSTTSSSTTSSSTTSSTTPSSTSLSSSFSTTTTPPPTFSTTSLPPHIYSSAAFLSEMGQMASYKANGVEFNCGEGMRLFFDADAESYYVLTAGPSTSSSRSYHDTLTSGPSNNEDYDILGSEDNNNNDDNSHLTLQNPSSTFKATKIPSNTFNTSQTSSTTSCTIPINIKTLMYHYFFLDGSNEEMTESGNTDVPKAIRFGEELFVALFLEPFSSQTSNPNELEADSILSTVYSITTTKVTLDRAHYGFSEQYSVHSEERNQQSLGNDQDFVVGRDGDVSENNHISKSKNVSNNFTNFAKVSQNSKFQSTASADDVPKWYYFAVQSKVFAKSATPLITLDRVESTNGKISIESLLLGKGGKMRAFWGLEPFDIEENSAINTLDTFSIDKNTKPMNNGANIDNNDNSTNSIISLQKKEEEKIKFKTKKNVQFLEENDNNYPPHATPIIFTPPTSSKSPFLASSSLSTTPQSPLYIVLEFELQGEGLLGPFTIDYTVDGERLRWSYQPVLTPTSLSYIIIKPNLLTWQATLQYDLSSTPLLVGKKIEGAMGNEYAIQYFPGSREVRSTNAPFSTFCSFSLQSYQFIDQSSSSTIKTLLNDTSDRIALEQGIAKYGNDQAGDLSNWFLKLSPKHSQKAQKAQKVQKPSKSSPNGQQSSQSPSPLTSFSIHDVITLRCTVPLNVNMKPSLDDVVSESYIAIGDKLNNNVVDYQFEGLSPSLSPSPPSLAALRKSQFETFVEGYRDRFDGDVELAAVHEGLRPILDKAAVQEGLKSSLDKDILEIASKHDTTIGRSISGNEQNSTGKMSTDSGKRDRSGGNADKVRLGLVNESERVKEAKRMVETQIKKNQKTSKISLSELKSLPLITNSSGFYNTMIIKSNEMDIESMGVDDSEITQASNRTRITKVIEKDSLQPPNRSKMIKKGVGSKISRSIGDTILSRSTKALSKKYIDHIVVLDAPFVDHGYGFADLNFVDAPPLDKSQHQKNANHVTEQQTAPLSQINHHQEMRSRNLSDQIIDGQQSRDEEVFLEGETNEMHQEHATLQQTLSKAKKASLSSYDIIKAFYGSLFTYNPNNNGRYSDLLMTGTQGDKSLRSTLKEQKMAPNEIISTAQKLTPNEVILLSTVSPFIIEWNELPTDHLALVISLAYPGNTNTEDQMTALYQYIVELLLLSTPNDIDLSQSLFSDISPDKLLIHSPWNQHLDGYWYPYGPVSSGIPGQRVDRMANSSTWVEFGLSMSLFQGAKIAKLNEWNFYRYSLKNGPDLYFWDFELVSTNSYNVAVPQCYMKYSDSSQDEFFQPACRVPIGSPCYSNSQCVEGFCVDNKCINEGDFVSHFKRNLVDDYILEQSDPTAKFFQNDAFVVFSQVILLGVVLASILMV